MIPLTNDNLNETLQGVAPNNLLNYNETNITDNPEVKKVLAWRGICRVERKAEHSKQSISMMLIN